MDHYTEFISLIHDFIDLFRSLTTVEQQKLDAAVANDLSILEDCMKKEQAFVLRLRGLEQQRDTLQRKLKMKDLKFREILSRVPDEVKEELTPLFQECDLCEFTQDPVCFKFRSAGCRRIFRIRYKQTR